MSIWSFILFLLLLSYFGRSSLGSSNHRRPCPALRPPPHTRGRTLTDNQYHRELVHFFPFKTPLKLFPSLMAIPSYATRIRVLHKSMTRESISRGHVLRTAPGSRLSGKYKPQFENLLSLDQPGQRSGSGRPDCGLQFPSRKPWRLLALS